MAQYSYGTADIAIGAWIDEGEGTSNLYDGLNAQSYDESTFIQSGNNPDFGDFYVGSLGPAPTAPAASVGTFKYIYAKNGARDLEIGVRVLSGTTELSIGTHATISTSTTQSEITFSTDQGIDYSNLSWTVQANDSGGGGGTRGRVYWIEFELLDAASSATTRTLSDLAGITENLDTADHFVRQLSDTTSSGTLEVLAVYRTISSVTTGVGSAQLSDQIADSWLVTRELGDLTGLTDQLERQYSVYTRFLSDDNALAENQTNSVTEAAAAGETVSASTFDLFTFSDQILTGDIFTRQPQDLAGLSDQILTGDIPGRQLQDTFTFADQVSAYTFDYSGHIYTVIHRLAEEIV